MKSKSRKCIWSESNDGMGVEVKQSQTKTESRRGFRLQSQKRLKYRLTVREDGASESKTNKGQTRNCVSCWNQSPTLMPLPIAELLSASCCEKRRIE
jgi:hypothetical protein